MRQDGKPENQHYVPKMLLKNFCNSKEQLYVYDKWEKRIFPGPTNMKKVAAERNFNVVEQNGEKLDTEPVFTFIETNAEQVISKLLKAQKLSILTSKDETILALFVAMQYFRTKHTRESITQMNAAIAAHIRRVGHDPAKVEGFKELNELEIKALSLQMLQSVPECASYIEGKHWLLLQASQETLFYISDNPIAFHNDKTFGPYGNLGFAAPGIQIYCPLSPTFTFAMYCPSVLGEGHQIQENHQSNINQQKALAILGSTPKIRKSAGIFVDSMTSFIESHPTMKESMKLFERSAAGEPIPQSPENMEFANYLQVRFSNRYVYSYKNDFELVERILNDHPNWNKGLMPRMD
jgi:hypothetical protein